MSKEIKSNTFNNGLMMDLHPINTPNTVLTDNLNGTIITYDGNEHVLQNDMGNYRLKDCKLKSNYIPIGLKEYAGILYIVSYNPLDEHVEIGTYPSPEIKTPSTYSGVEKQLSTFESLSGKYNYSSLTNPQSVIWYDEKLKIHPGDYYKITTDAFDNLRIIKNAWFIMTDDKTLQEIEIKQNLDDFTPVTWEYPGYMVFQQKIVTPTEFEAFVSQLNIPNYIESEESDLPDLTDGKIGFEMSLSRIDYNRITNGKNLNEVIDVDVVVTKVKQDGSRETLDVEWDNDQEKFTVYDFGESEINVFGLLDLTSSISGLKKSDTLIFDITPVFKDDNFSIVFDQYKTSAAINLNKIGTVDDLEIGSEVYKFWRKNDTCYIIFDIASPTIVAGDVHLYYRLTDLNGNEVMPWTYFEDEVLSGENMIAMHLTYEQKEQIYILEFCFGSQDTPDVEMFNKSKFRKLLITSIVFNEFVGTKSTFDKEIAFPDWYKLHDKYVNFDQSDFVLNVKLDNYTFNTNTEKEILKTTNERYWKTTSEDALDFTYSLAVKEGEENPKLDYTYGYLQQNVPVDGNIQKLNENLLNIGLWKIDEQDVKISVGDTKITCNSDGTFSSNDISCVLAKNVVIDTMVNESAGIPSVDKVFVNRNLSIEQTKNGVTTVLENQQLVGHQYGAGAANSSKDRRRYDWAAENIITSVVTLASKMSVFMSSILSATKIASIVGGALGVSAGVASIILIMASTAIIPGAGLIVGAIAVVASVLVGVMLVAVAIGQAFSTERHISWASGLYSTNVETFDDIMDQFDKVTEGNYKPNEKFTQSLSLAMIDRKQGVQWDKKSDKSTELQNMVQSFLQKNQPVTYETNGEKVTSVVKGGSPYSCFPVLFQEYTTENNIYAGKDGICIFTPGGKKYFNECSEFETQYSVWIAFMTPSNVNSLVYVPCTFDGHFDKILKIGSISNSVDKKTGAITNSNGIVSENDNTTITDVSKMVASAMVWCRNLFVIPEEGEILKVNFMEPIIPEIPNNVSLVFEYSCEYDYSKSKYLGKVLYNNARIDTYGLNGKVSNLSLMTGASVLLENRTIADKVQVDVLESVADSVLNAITEKINIKLSEYGRFSEYCKNQIYYSKLDPVVTENTIRNGKIKGVYNTLDSYDAEGGLINQLNKLSDLNGTLTYPKTDSPLRYYLCGRKNGKIGETYNQIFVTLGYNSNLTLDCTDSYFNFQSK